MIYINNQSKDIAANQNDAIQSQVEPSKSALDRSSRSILDQYNAKFDAQIEMLQRMINKVADLSGVLDNINKTIAKQKEIIENQNIPIICATSELDDICQNVCISTGESKECDVLLEKGTEIVDCISTNDSSMICSTVDEASCISTCEINCQDISQQLCGIACQATGEDQCGISESICGVVDQKTFCGIDCEVGEGPYENCKTLTDKYCVTSGEKYCIDVDENTCIESGEEGCVDYGEDFCINVGEDECLVNGEASCIVAGEEDKCLTTGEANCEAVGEEGCIYPGEEYCEAFGEAYCHDLGEALCHATGEASCNTKKETNETCSSIADQIEECTTIADGCGPGYTACGPDFADCGNSSVCPPSFGSETHCGTDEGCGTCEAYCQDYCEQHCQVGCETSCQGTCDQYCQTCQGSCNDTCHDGCQGTCDKTEQGCHTTSECGTCQECQSICLNYCEDACEDECQSGQGCCGESCQGMWRG